MLLDEGQRLCLRSKWVHYRVLCCKRSAQFCSNTAPHLVNRQLQESDVQELLRSQDTSLMLWCTESITRPESRGVLWHSVSDRLETNVDLGARESASSELVYKCNMSSSCPCPVALPRHLHYVTHRTSTVCVHHTVYNTKKNQKTC